MAFNRESIDSSHYPLFPPFFFPPFLRVIVSSSGAGRRRVGPRYQVYRGCWRWKFPIFAACVATDVLKHQRLA